MRVKIIEWIESCTLAMIKHHKNNEEAILIKAFITQYELKAIDLLSHPRKSTIQKNIPYWKQKTRHRLYPQIQSPCFQKEKFKQVDVLFWPFQQMHVDVQIDIYKELLVTNKLDIGIISHNQPIIEKLSSLKLDGYIDNPSRIIPWSDYKLNKNYKSIMDKAATLPPLVINNTSIKFKDVIISAWNSWYSLYQYTVDTFNALLKEVKPKSIFVGNNITLAGNIISHLAKKESIKVICIMHGRMNSYLSFSHFDYFYLFGKRDKENLVAAGIDSNKLIVSGSPKLKNIPPKSTTHNETPSILIALSGPGHSITREHHIKTLEVIKNVALENPSVTFNFKLHKKDKLEYYSKLISLENVFVQAYSTSGDTQNIYTWLSECDALITGASTSALDAMSMGIPVITVDLLHHLNNVDLINEGITLHATDQTTLSKHITSILSGSTDIEMHLKKSNAFFKDMYTQPKEGSVAFISNHLEQILHEA